jgi:hypothetical protein
MWQRFAIRLLTTVVTTIATTAVGTIVRWYILKRMNDKESEPRQLSTGETYKV